jgi:hypothetical protein
MPKFFNAAANRPTSRRSSRALIVRCTRFSPLKISAGPSSVRRSRFSAKLSRASGKNRAPGISSKRSVTCPPLKPRMPVKSQSDDQNASGRSSEN